MVIGEGGGTIVWAPTSIEAGTGLCRKRSLRFRCRRHQAPNLVQQLFPAGALCSAAPVVVGSVHPSALFAAGASPSSAPRRRNFFDIPSKSRPGRLPLRA
jgi:hypothetical protein